MEVVINIFDYKVFTHNNELYAISQNNLPGKLTIPSEFQGNNIVTPIFTPSFVNRAYWRYTKCRF